MEPSLVGAHQGSGFGCMHQAGTLAGVPEKPVGGRSEREANGVARLKEVVPAR